MNNSKINEAAARLSQLRNSVHSDPLEFRKLLYKVYKGFDSVETQRMLDYITLAEAYLEIISKNKSE